MQGETTVHASFEARQFRTAQLLRASVLVVVGVGIAFTAPLHRQLAFDQWVLFVAFALLGAATMLEYRAVKASMESWWLAARAVLAFAAAGAMIAVADTFSLALTVSLWALLTAGVTSARYVRKVQPSRVALPSLLLSLALALTVFLAREDAVAIIGFFGAYAIVRGVFLAISALDHSVAANGSLAATQDNE